MYKADISYETSNSALSVSDMGYFSISYRKLVLVKRNLTAHEVECEEQCVKMYLDNYPNMTIQEWNGMIVDNLLPNIVILFIFIFLAAFGNVLVILVYNFRMRGYSEERYYIPILSVFDLIAATYCGGFMIYQCFHQVTFQNEILCKTLQFFVGFVTYIPILLLVIISFQRYLRVCKPLKPPMTVGIRRSLVVVSVLISFAGAMPLGFVFGTIPHQSSRYNLTGSRCGKINTGIRLVRAIYSIVLGVLALAVFSVLIFLYFKIGAVVYKNYKKTNKKSKLNLSNEESRKNSDENKETSVENTEYLTDYETKSVDCDDTDSKPSNTTIPMSSVKVSNKLGKKNRRLTYKLAIIFFVITLVFFVSFIPKASVLFVESVDKEFWETLSDEERPGVVFIYDIFILNNIANPIIYILMDTKFKNEATLMLKQAFTLQ